MKLLTVKLLIIEDQDNLRSTLVQGLEEQGYAVDAAPDGDEGLFLALSTDYDAIVLDLMLPQIDGWAILEKLRQTKSTPVLILTARDGLGDRLRGLDDGADDFLTKPFHFRELCSRLRALIRRSSGHATAILKAGDVVVDCARRTLSLRGEPVKVTRMEYNIVEILAHQIGSAVSREYLYEHLHDENDDSLGNSLYVHISNLRRKFGKDFIKTVPGHGYLIEDA